MNEFLDFSGNKGFRLLSMYERLNKGELLNKPALALQFGVTEKSIQRDIDELRNYLAETHGFESEVSIQYDKGRNGYYLVRFEREWLTNEEVLGICKVLLESRAFCKEELNTLLAKLLSQATPNDRKLVEGIIQNEQFHYVPLHHGKQLISQLWKLSEWISKSEILSLTYRRMDGVERVHQIKPVGLMFSEYYFYLIAFMADGSKDFPTTFRVDRIAEVSGTGERFSVPYKDRFSEGEFRKRVQFMYAGALRKVKFTYSGQSIEAVLDRLPTAVVLSEKDGVYTVEAEVYGSGIEMWLRSQGESVKTAPY